MTSPEWCATWMRLWRNRSWRRFHHERKRKGPFGSGRRGVEVGSMAYGDPVSTRLAGDAGRDQALEVEAVFAQQCFHMFATLLRASVTTRPATTTKGSLDRYLPDILEIAELIAAGKKRTL